MTSKVLVVDDQIVSVLVIQEILKNNGYEVITTTLSSSVSSLIEKNSPHLVILDILMPDIDGLETIKVIKKSDPHLPIIATSTNRRYLKIAERLGANASYAKPVLHDDFIALVHKFKVPC